MRRIFGLLFLCSVILPPVAASPPDDAAIRLDAFGDPLPNGVIARLGTRRFVHTRIEAVAISPDGTIVASAGIKARDNDSPRTSSIRLWDTSTGKLIREFDTPGPSIRSLAFSRDGKNLAGACSEYVCLWNAATGQLLKQMRAPRSFDQVLSVNFSADGKYIISNHNQHLIRRWQPETEYSRAFEAPKEESLKHDGTSWSYVRDGVLSPDGKMIAWPIVHRIPNPGKEDIYRSSLLLVETVYEKVVHKIGEWDGEIASLAFSVDGQTLAVGTLKDLLLIDVKQGKTRLAVKGVPEHPHGLQFMTDGKTIASMHHQRRFFLWDTTTGAKISECPFPASGHYAISADGQTIAAMSGWDALRIWERKAGREQPAFPGHRDSAYAHFANSRELITDDFHTICTWDTATWKQKQSFVKSARDATSYTDKTFFAQRDSSWHVFDLIDGRRLRTLEAPTADKQSTLARCSRDGNTLAFIGTTKDGLRFWAFYDVKNDKKLARVHWEKWSIHLELVFAPDGNAIVQQFNDGNLNLVDVKTGKVVQRFAKKPNDVARSFTVPQLRVFSPDGRYLVTAPDGAIGGADQGGAIRIWEMKSGRELQRFELPGFGDRRGPTIHDLAVSPDHRFVAFRVTEDKSIHVLEIASGQLRGWLCGNDEEFHRLSYSPDARTLVSTCWDSTVLVWDMIRPLKRKARPDDPLAVKELEARWKSLADADGVKADEAIWDLVHSAKTSVPFLRERVKPIVAASPAQLQKWIAELGHADFRTREHAAAQLRNQEQVALPALENALKEKRSLEEQQRIRNLLQKMELAGRVRECRVLEILERIGGGEAQDFLQALARGTQEAHLTQEAVACLRRLSQK